MSKTLVSLVVPDLSAFAKALRASLKAIDHQPSHVELLNLLAKAAGHGNFQSMRAAHPRDIAANPVPAHNDRIEKVLRHFDADGVMIRWPGKTSHQDLCLWVIWLRLPTGERLSEVAVNDVIKAGHAFGDHALLRRSLVDMKMLARTPDGKIYRRIEKQPSADAVALMEAIARRFTTLRH